MSVPQGKTGYDVAIVGGGPAGSTAATLLRQYNPALRVLVLEKETFPRSHIGESQLPAISAILHEMGAWEKVEAAGFPIKLGASYTWGRNGEAWDFDFYPVEEFRDEPRPGRYEGQRQFTAFQVERSAYDQILIDHAASMGAEVRQGTMVREVVRERDRVSGLRLDSDELVTARYYIDATGTTALIRRTMGIEIDCPDDLRNVAVWDYWENAEWAVTIGVGGTRVQIRSLPYGWLWFIPLGPTRTSVGLVCPAEHYRATGKSLEQLYRDAVHSEPAISALIRNATPRGQVEATKDWSTLARRLVGENWFLVGEAAGFADPILAAGMTLAHTSAREAAYVILQMERDRQDAPWLRKWYDHKNRTNIEQHIRFALYWYAANGCFTDLQQQCASIAKDAGLSLKPGDAWRWLAQGGFASQDTGFARFGSFDLASARTLVERFFGGGAASFEIEKFNVYRLRLLGAEKSHLAELRDGRISRIDCYRRHDRVLPLSGPFANVVRTMRLSQDAHTIAETLVRRINTEFPEHVRSAMLSQHVQAWEAMLTDGWLDARFDPAKRPLKVTGLQASRNIRSTKEGLRALRERQA